MSGGRPRGLRTNIALVVLLITVLAVAAQLVRTQTANVRLEVALASVEARIEANKNHPRLILSRSEVTTLSLRLRAKNGEVAMVAQFEFAPTPGAPPVLVTDPIILEIGVYDLYATVRFEHPAIGSHSASRAHRVNVVEDGPISIRL